MTYFYFQGLRKCFLEISIRLEVLLAALFISVSNRYQKKTIFCFSRLGKKVTKMCFSKGGILWRFVIKICLIKRSTEVIRTQWQNFLQDPRTISLNHLLLWNSRAYFAEASQKATSQHFLLNSFKTFGSMQNSSCHGNRRKLLFSSDCSRDFIEMLQGCSLATLCQTPSDPVDPLKNMAPNGQGIFAVYGYNSNLEIFFSESVVKRDLKEILQECSLSDSLSDSVNSYWSIENLTITTACLRCW